MQWLDSLSDDIPLALAVCGAWLAIAIVLGFLIGTFIRHASAHAEMRERADPSPAAVKESRAEGGAPPGPLGPS